MNPPLIPIGLDRGPTTPAYRQLRLHEFSPETEREYTPSIGGTSPLVHRVVSLLDNNTSAIGAKRTLKRRQPGRVYGLVAREERALGASTNSLPSTLLSSQDARATYGIEAPVWELESWQRRQAAPAYSEAANVLNLLPLSAG